MDVRAVLLRLTLSYINPCMNRILLLFCLLFVIVTAKAQVGAPVKYIIKYQVNVAAYSGGYDIHGVMTNYSLTARLTNGTVRGLNSMTLYSHSRAESASGEVRVENDVASLNSSASYQLDYFDQDGNSVPCSGSSDNSQPVNSGYNLNVGLSPGSSCGAPNFNARVRLLPAIMIKNMDRTDPLQTVYCDNETVRLKLDYHGGGGTSVAWQYRLDNGNFLPIPGNNMGNEISITLQSLFGASYTSHLNQRIEFRAAGANTYTNGTPMTGADEGSNIFAYSFSPSTALPTDIKSVDPLCGIGLSTALNIQFNRALIPGEQLTSITLFKVVGGVNILHDQFQTATGTLGAGNILSWTGVVGMPAGEYYVNVEGKYNGVVQCNRTNYTFNVAEAKPVGFTVTGKQNVRCFGGADGSITVTGSGGAGPYSYSKDNGASWQTPSNVLSGLSKGSYTIRVRDVNGCLSAASEVVAIDAPTAALAASVLSYTDPRGAVTNDGTVTIGVSGGTTPYTYLWTNGATTQNLSGAGGGTHTVTVRDNNNCTTTTSENLIAPDPIDISFAETAISCNGMTDGALQASITGGVKPYTFSWIDGKTTATIGNLGAGLYTFNVRDANGITFSRQYDLKEPDVLRVAATPVSTSCYEYANGSITTAVTGGTLSYSYLWTAGETTPGLSGLTAGTYTLTVTDGHNCKAIGSATVEQPDDIVIGGVITTPTRFGSTDGSIVADITGGTSPYDYLWYNNNTTNTVTGLGDGNYNLAITDKNGCTASRIYNVAQPDPLTMDMIATDVLCNGLSTGELHADVKGGVLPYTYEWSNGSSADMITGLPVGNYSVKVTDKSGVVTNSSYTVKEPPLLQLSLTATEVSCGGISDGTVTSTSSGGVLPYTYSWNTGQSGPALSGLNGGMYTLHLTDAHGCILSRSATVTAPGALSASATVKDPVCYGYSDGAITLDITGGRTPYSFEWSNGADSKDLSAIPAGDYSLFLRDRTGCLITYQYTLTDPAELQVDLGRDRTLCVGQSLSLNGTIPDGVTYSWNSSNGFMAATPSVTLSDAGTYNVLSTDNKGCKAKDEISIIKDGREVNAVFLMSTAGFTGENVVAVNVSQPVADRVNWLLPAEATVVSQSDLVVEMNFKKAGHYKVLLTTFIGDCEETMSNDLMIVEGTKLPEVNTAHTSLFKQVILHPNPTNGQFDVDVETAEDVTVNYRFLDIQRNLIVFEQKGQLNKDAVQRVPFNIPGLSAGVYVLLIESPKEKKTLKVIVL